MPTYRHPCRLWTLALLLVVLAAGRARAQIPVPPALRPAAAQLHLMPAAPSPPTSIAEQPEGESPRRTVMRFLAAVQAGRYADAARELELTSQQAAAGPTLARHLAAVLNQRLSLDLEHISDLPAGDQRDGIGLDQEELGRIQGPALREPVRLRRLGSDDNSRWVFTRQTVSRIESWYDRLPDRWLRDHLPEVLLRVGPQGLCYWQWLALPPFLLANFLLAALLVWLLSLVLTPLARRTRAVWDDRLLVALRTPLRLILTALIAGEWLPLAYLTQRAERFVLGLLSVTLTSGVFFALWRTIDVLVRVAADSAWLKARPSARAMIPLGRRIGEVTLLSIVTVTILQSLGLQVTSLLAGLGIGGLAVALAAQKTVEHLFGGVMLSLDQPMRVGDYVKVGEILGTVEEIGLRSTRIRTLERTLITIPNGKLADMNIETYGARDRIRVYQVLALALDTPAERLRALLGDLEALLRQRQEVYAESVVVRLNGMSDSALQVELSCYVRTQEFTEYQTVRHHLLLAVLEKISAHGAAPGYPGRTVRMPS